MKANFVSHITKGHLDSGCRHSIQRLLKAHEGKKVRVTIEEYKKKRSSDQNAFYWGVVIPLVIEMFLDNGQPMSIEDTHTFLKEQVGKLYKQVNEPSGSISTITRSSTDLNTKEWEDYITCIRVWAAQWGKIIPLPNE